MAMVEELIEDTGDDSDRFELTGILLFFRFARGTAEEADIARWDALAGDRDDLDARQYREALHGEALMLAGDLEGAYARLVAGTDDTTNDQVAPARALRCALWLGDAERGAPMIDRLERIAGDGRRIRAEKVWVRACAAAFAGRRDEALAGFNRAIADFSEIGMNFEAALIGIDMLKALPDEELSPTTQRARATLTEIGATAFLRLLEAALPATEAVA